MATTLFRDTTYSTYGLIESIKRGAVALPDIQRPFVRPASKVRDLLDSMYKGFPVGYLLFWETGADPGARQIGVGEKQAVPALLIVDGQQRLTSLYAVMTGSKIVRQDYTEARIRIAFRPTDATFAVADAAIEKDPEFIADVSEPRSTGTSSRSALSSQVGSLLAVAGRCIQKVNRLSGRNWPPTRQNDRLQRRHRWIQA